MAAALAASQVPSELYARPRPQRILVLGGTNFLGPAIVERAIKAGHQVTLFNRGKTNPGLFPELEKIRGDRQTSGQGGISALSGKRRWDAVIDVWPSDPAVVMPTAQLLADRTDSYSFVSSIGAYAQVSRPGTEESAPLRLTESGYGGDKARSEEQLTFLLGPKLGIVRPCPIAGPRDDSLSFHYWLAQLAQNKQVVAPGDGSDPVEIVDVRDVAAWIVQNVEARRTGVYNVCGRPTPFRAFLQESGSAIHGGAQLVWIDQKFLLKEGVHAGDNMPYWMPDSPAFAQFSSMKARRAGWITRPLKETAADAWKSYCTRIDPNLPYPQHQWRYNWGISAERQTQILQNWKNRQRSIS